MAAVQLVAAAGRKRPVATAVEPKPLVAGRKRGEAGRDRSGSRLWTAAACGGPQRLGEGSVGQRRLERGAGRCAVDGEHNPLQSAAGLEMLAYFVDLDPRRPLEREAADAGAERHQRE